MNTKIRILDLIALLENTPASHFETGKPLLLRRGQIGTIVMDHDDSDYEAEFAGRDGRAYASLPLAADKLMVLWDAPEFAVA